MDKGNFTSALFLDFRKAFDIVNHQILLSKLRLYQCDDHSIKWFNSYLSGRCQKVKIGNEESRVLNQFIQVFHKVPYLTPYFL